jgi:hypothetical protein
MPPPPPTLPTCIEDEDDEDGEEGEVEHQPPKVQRVLLQEGGRHQGVTEAPWGPQTRGEGEEEALVQRFAQVLRGLRLQNTSINQGRGHTTMTISQGPPRAEGAEREA